MKSKALIITRDSIASGLYAKILEPELKVRIVGLIQLSKTILKTNSSVRIVVLDFGLQDKNGTNSLILRRVAEKNLDVYILVLLSHPIQRRMVNQILGPRYQKDRIKLVKGLGRYLGGAYFLRRAKRSVLASSRSERSVDS